MDDRKVLLLEKLTAVRGELFSLLESLEEPQWETAVFPGDAEANWTVTDLLRHLVDGERGMTGLMQMIRKGGEGVPADFDIHRWNARVVSKAQEKSSDELIAEMEQNRVALFQLIDELQPEDWPKKGRHASLRIMSIEEICHLIADHEKGHIESMRQALV